MVSIGKFGDEHFYVVPPSKPPFDGSDPSTLHCVPKDANLIAYWWIEPVERKDLANMVPDIKECRGISVPIFRNCKQLAPYTQLTRFVPPAPKAKSICAIKPDVEAAPAAKKGKKSK